MLKRMFKHMLLCMAICIIICPYVSNALTMEGSRIEGNWQNGTAKEFTFYLIGEKEPYTIAISGTNGNIYADRETVTVNPGDKIPVYVYVLAPSSGYLKFSEVPAGDVLSFGSEMRYKVCVNMPCPTPAAPATTAAPATPIPATTAAPATPIPATPIYEKETIITNEIPMWAYICMGILTVGIISLGYLYVRARKVDEG